MKTIIEMAREANDYATAALGVDAIPREWRALRDEQFAALVREDEREKIALAHKVRPRGKSVYPELLAGREKQQKPVGYFATDRDGFLFQLETTRGVTLYTTPPTAAIAARQMRDAAVRVCETNYGSDPNGVAMNLAEAIAALPVLEVQWQDLTEQDINELWDNALLIADPTAGNHRFKFARAVIAKFKEKQ